MTFAATILRASGAALQWVDVGTVIGRYERVSGAIGSAVALALVGLEAAIPVASPIYATWDNSPEVNTTHTPALAPANPQPMQVLVSLRWRDCSRLGTAALGSDTWRFSGVLSLTFISPIHRGDGPIYKAADYIADQFRAVTGGEVKYRTPSVVDGSPESEIPVGHYARTVEIPFDVDEDNARVTQAPAVSVPVAFEDAALVVSDRFADLIAGPLSLLTHYDNSPFVTPSNSAWCSLSILQGGTTLAARGSSTRSYRTVGIAQASIHVPLFTGDADALAIADDIFDAFHAAQDRGVTFQAPAIVSSGRSGSHWRVIVRIPFQVEAIQ